MSTDSRFTHKIWNEVELSKMVDGGVPFPMLSDAGGKVATVFGVATIVTMLAIVLAGWGGLRLLPLGPLERYVHALSGFAIAASGAAIKIEFAGDDVTQALAQLEQAKIGTGGRAAQDQHANSVTSNQLGRRS